MPVQQAYQSPYLYELDIEIEGKRADYLVGKMRLSRAYNKASTLTLEVLNRSGIDLFKIGAVCRLVGARGVGGGLDSVGGEGGNTVVKTLRFDGFIRTARPSENGVVVTLTDALSLLATGQIQDYKANDYVGEDLYFIAKSIMDTLNETTTSYGDTLGFSDAYGGKWLDTSNLYQGSGIIATPDMDVWGYQSPKEFIDKIFGQMYKRIDGGAGLAHEYEDAIYHLPWRYNVFSSNVITFYYTDIFLKNPKTTHKISEAAGTLLAKGIVAQIDTSRTVNNCTCVSSSDEALSANFSDMHSIRKYGDSSKRIDVDTTEYDTLQQAAFRLVQLFKEPSYSYAVKPTGQDLYMPGDVIQITAPAAGIDLALPVAEVDTVIGGGEIETTMTVGERRLPVNELVQKLAG